MRRARGGRGRDPAGPRPRLPRPGATTSRSSSIVIRCGRAGAIGQQLLDGLGVRPGPICCDAAIGGRRRVPRPVPCSGTLGREPGRQGRDRRRRDLLVPALRAGVDRSALAVRRSASTSCWRAIASSSPRPIQPRCTRHLGLYSSVRVARVASPPVAGRPNLSSPSYDMLQIDVGTALRLEIEDGFGDGKDGEDRFDAVVGLVGRDTRRPGCGCPRGRGSRGRGPAGSRPRPPRGATQRCAVVDHQAEVTICVLGLPRPVASAMNWSPMSMNAMVALRPRSRKSNRRP